MPIVDLSKYHTDGKEPHYIQIIHIVGRITENKKLTEENIKKAKFNFMLDLKTFISKTAIDPELTRIRPSMRREEKNTTLEGYRPVFDKLSIRWGLVFVEDQIAVPIDLRRKVIEILHFGHSGTTKMLSDAKIFWWPEMQKDIEQKVKDCTTGKNLNNQISKNQYGKLEKLSETGQELQINFTGKLNNKYLYGEPQILIAIDRFSKWPTANHMVMARTKTEERQLTTVMADGNHMVMARTKTEERQLAAVMADGNHMVMARTKTEERQLATVMADGNHMVMARTKTEERQLATETKSPEKRNSVRYPFKVFEKDTTENL